MRKSLNSIILKSGLLALTLILSLFASCEIGLGPSVDTETPTLIINDPPVDSVVRDAFAIKGTWADDGDIDKIKVTLRRTDVNISPFSCEAVFEGEEGNGTWSAVINPETDGISDGSYEATIEITDGAKHRMSQTRTFVIDNTPPIIVLTRPSTAADSLSSDTYGQTFTLEGQAADTNSVSLIEMEIYGDKECTPESYIHTIPLKNVPNSINLDVAKFEKGNTENDYYKIYKDATTDGGAKEFYCKIIAYDGAQRFPSDGSEQSLEDQKGNATVSYYLYKDIATEILQNYKINEVYSILNGTFSDTSSRSVSKEDVIKKLQEKLKYKGKFTLNPKNNPTFSVTGRNPLLLDGHDFEGSSNNISDGSQIVIEVSPGLDGILLDEDSLKVYALECDANGKPKNNKKIYPDTTRSESGTSYRFVTTISRDKGFEINKTYIFGVEGYDQSVSKNTIEPVGKGYGFRMATSGKAPTLVVNTPDSISYVKENGTVTFTGTVSVEAGVPELKLYKGNMLIHTFEFTESEAQLVNNENQYSFKYSYNTFSGSSAQLDFKLVASQNGNESDYKPTMTVLYVSGEPGLKDTIKGPLVASELYPSALNADNLNNINGDFSFEGTISQKVGLYDVIDYENSKWSFTAKDANGNDKTLEGELEAAFSQTLNTRDFADKTVATLVLTIKDLAGNEKVKTYQYFINQESDKPRLIAQNFDKDVDTEAKLDERVALKKSNSLGNLKSNMFSTSQTLKFTVEDDDEVKETKVRITHDGDVTLEDADGFTLQDGKSKLEFFVYDVNYDDSKDAEYNKNYVYTFTVWVLKGQAPNVNVNATPDYVTTLTANVSADAKKDFTVIGNVSGVGEYTLSFEEAAGNEGAHQIYYKLRSETVWQQATEVTNTINGKSVKIYLLYPASNYDNYKTSIQWKDIFTPKAGSTGGKVTYTTNGALMSTDYEFDYSTDSERPVIALTDESVKKGTLYSSSFRFNGTADDEGTGIKEVQIQFTNKGSAVNEANWISVDGTSNWFKEIFFANASQDSKLACFTTQSQKTMHVRATDGAGNYSAVASKDFNYDTENPTITINNAPDGYLPKGTYTLTGYITEKYGITSGTKLIVGEYLRDGNDWKKQGNNHEITITQGSGENQDKYNWSMGIPFVSTLSGDLKYTFSIKDANNNSLNSDDLLLNRDIDAPTVTIISPSSSTFGINSLSGTSATLTGSVTEKDKDKLYYQIKKGTAAASAADWLEQDISGLGNVTETWRISLQLDTAAYPAGKYTLYVKAKDRAGNESATVSQYFSIDREDPKPVVEVIDSSNNSITATLTGSQTIKVTSGTGYKIKITATDDGSINSVSLKDTTNPAAVIVVPITKSGNVWTSNALISTEGTKSYKVEVIDDSGKADGSVKGKVKEETKAVIYDKDKPAASFITIPTDDAWVSGTGKVYISGEATDASGIQSITMKLNSGAAKIVPVANPWTYELDCEGLTENDSAANSRHSLVLTVKDNCEKTTTITRYFKLDKSSPVIKNLSVKNPSTGTFTKDITTVTASGMAYDGAQSGYRPVTVTVSAKDADGNAVNIGGTNGVITIPTTSTQNSDFGKFSQAVATEALPDGEYTFTVKATDFAGIPVEQETLITIDNSAPSVTTPTLDDWNSKHSSAKINVTFNDKNPDAVYYYVNDFSDTSIKQASDVGANDWTVMTLSETSTADQYTASKSHSFADGQGVVYLMVVDKSGNVSYQTTEVYNVDTKAPDVCTLGTVDGATLDGSKLINGENDVTFTLYASDYNDNNNQTTGLPIGNDVQKIDSVKLTKIGDMTYTGANIVTATPTLSGTNKTGEWTIKIPKSKFSGKTTGSYPVTVTVADSQGNSKEFQLFTLDIDQGKPEIQSYALDSSYDAGLVGASASKVQTFYMNNKKKGFKLTGVAKDDREIEKVSLTLKQNGTTIVKTADGKNSFESPDSAWTFELNNNVWKNLTGYVEATLSVVDKAKNPGKIPDSENKLPPLTFKIVFDTQGPSAVHVPDTDGKDLYFRIADQSNDDIDENSHPKWVQSKDEDIGGKYEIGTYGNKETITIRGKFVDRVAADESSAAGSGVERIYYKVFNQSTAPSDSDISDFVNNYEAMALADTINIGYFSPLITAEKKRVFYTDDDADGDGINGNLNGKVTPASPAAGETNPITSVWDGRTKYYTEIESTFKTKIPGFNHEGSYYIILLAVDKVGNVCVDTVTPAEGTNPAVNYYKINIDISEPEVTSIGNIYTNASEDLKLAFEVTDKPVNGAGVKSVTVKLDNKSQVAVLDEDSTSPYYGKWVTTFTKANLPTVSNEYSVLVRVVDKSGSGNPDEPKAGTVIVDKNNPEVKINAINDADKDTQNKLDVNGSIVITGTASDTVNLTSVKIEYKKTSASDTPANWTSLANEDSINNWKATLVTTALDDKTDYDLRVTAVDAAGNKNTDSKTIYVNQDSDRPIVKFTNLTKDEAGHLFLKYGDKATLEGIVSDDDAESTKVVKTFIASYTPITSATGTASGSTQFTSGTGDFKFTPAAADQEDGQKTVYFYIKDNNDKEYYTTYTGGTNPELNRPFQQYKTDPKEDNKVALSYKSDSNAPKINSVELQAWKTATEKNDTAKPLGSSCIVGGSTKNIVDLKVSANDGNGIKGIVIELEQQKNATQKVTKYYRSNSEVSFKVGNTDVTFDSTGNIAKTTDKNTNHVYTIPQLNLTSSGFKQDSESSIDDIKDGVVKVRVYVYDNSGLYSNQESQFVIDNTAPVLNITAPVANGEEVYAMQSNTVGGNIEATDVEKIYYTVTVGDTDPATDDSPTDMPASGWHEVTNARLSASLIFDDDVTSTENGFHSNTLREWLKTLTGKTNEQLNENDDKINMYVHFKAVDVCGNEGWSWRGLSVIPNGDKPTIELVYPENKTNGDTPSLAGTIRVYGYATVPLGTIVATYIQIDPDYNGTAFNENGWETALNGVTALHNVHYTVEDIGTSGQRGIKANGTQNWNLPINGNSEFNPTGNDSRKMAIRIIALSNSGKISYPYEQLFDVDPNAPHIGGDGSLTGNDKRWPIQIVEFDDATAAQTITNNTNPVSYKTEMWVKGQKYLIASVYDDSGIKKIYLNENLGFEKVKLVEGGVINTAAKTHEGKTINVSQVTCGYAGKKNFNIIIPLPTDSGSGSVNYQLEATEDSDNNNSCTETIIVNYDNTAPKIGTASHAKYNIDADIHQSNGFYTFKSYVSDAEGSDKVSGMMGVAFYFVRRGASNTRVYDPMWNSRHTKDDGNGGITNDDDWKNYVEVRTGDNDASDITYSHGLFWKHKDLEDRDDGDLTKLTLDEADDNIHAGGLALLGGNIYRISSVSGTDVYVEGEVPKEITTADFALALVVDNLNRKETATGRDKITDGNDYGYGYYEESSTADDGDLMQEDWDGTSVEGIWTAIVNSANIPDGPIELHYVAFDKSQNYSVGIVGNVDETTYLALPTKDAKANKDIDGDEDTINKLATNFYYAYDAGAKAYVSNHAPRIAGVTVGTDYNGDTKITDGSKDANGKPTLNEKRTKYVETDLRVISGTAQTKVTKISKKFIASSNQQSNGDSLMTVKDKTTIELEIIGGNGDMYYQYNIASDYNDSIADGDFTKNNTALTINRAANEGLNEEFDYYVTSKLPIIEFTEAQLIAAVGGNNGTNGKRWWTVQVWDSTEETTHFVNSQYAELKLPLNVQVLDKTDPNTVISPLYWKSATDNSVYRDINGNRLGHVELKGELETGAGKLGNSSLYGSEDDKISGIVVFKGFAYDNKRLANLKWAVIDHSATNAYTTPTYLFPATNSALQNGATFTSGAWSSTATLASNYYTFEVSDAAEDGAYLDEKGHKVAWTLTVDTSYIKNVVEKDARIYVYAQDTAGRTTTITNAAVTSTSTDQETYDLGTKIPTYQVDILPYITRVKTKLAKKNKKNPEVFSRTSKGHYPIASSETKTGTVVLEGFNLAAGNATVDISSGMGTRTSGAYAYTVTGTIETINNINNNDAHGSYNINAANLSEETKVTNMYNRTPSSNTNLTLNDDVYFDMWEFKTAAAPKTGRINEPVMRINPRNQSIGFGFANGADRLSLPNGNDTGTNYAFSSYQLWQGNFADYKGINFVYDSDGNVHSVSTGLDTQPSDSIAGYMNYIYSTWGSSGENFHNWHGGRNAALESVAIPSGVYIGGEALTANLYDLDRFGKPAIAVSTPRGDADVPTVYIAYYDGDNDHIRFRYGTVTKTKAGRTNTLGQLSDNTAASGTIGSDTNNRGTGYTNHLMFEASANYYSVLAGKTQGANQVDTGNGTSEFVALDVISGADTNSDVVVIVWYDGSDLMYTYRYGTKDDTDCKSTGVANKWAEPKVIFEGAGQYCTIKVDKNNGIHIAAYNRSGADLYYAYMPGYDQYSKLKTALVDSYSQVGKYISLDTALVLREGSTTAYNVVPYITYYGDGFEGLPKLAYLPGGINSASPVVPDGATDADDLFTGSWEVSVIPTSSSVNEDNMNVALWKTTAGVLTASTRPNNYTEPTIAAGTNTANWYGNGTSNVVLGYGITVGATGFIEIAQRK